MKAAEFITMLGVLLLLLYVLWSWLRQRSAASMLDDDDDWVGEEPFVQTPVAAPNTTEPLNLQDAIDFSDIVLTPEQRTEWQEHINNIEQVETVNERFQAAKRRTEEYRMKPGVYTNKKRRQLIETLVRRPFCGRRARAWRTAFSDTMRGDVVPKNVKDDKFGMMRIGRRNPDVDLHQGALGPLSGRSGAWLSDENIPENLFDDQDAFMVE